MSPCPRVARFARCILALTLVLFGAVPASAQSFRAPAHAGGRHVPGEILVKFKPGSRASDRAAVRASVNARPIRDFDFIKVEHLEVRGQSAEQAVARLRNNPHVEYVELNYELYADVIPNDPRFPDLYGMRNTGQTGGTAGADIKAVLAWDQFTGDPNIKIGVIDTGVDYNHPDLAANVWTNPGEIPGNSIDDDGNGYVDDIHGYDTVNNDGDPMDDNGHGSHCSGTIAGVGNNNVGVVGVNWNAKIVGIKFLSAGGSGSTAGAIAGVNYAIAVGVKLTSNSWGGGGFSQALLDAINAAGAQGQLFIAAAGNSTANTDVSPHYPSSYASPYIIAVAATDHNDNLASFSNYGATTVDLAAPGVAIVSTTPGNTYQSFSGTSMATPHVAGVAALAMGRFPAVPALQIKNLILNAADPKPQLAGKVLTGARLNAFMTIAEPDDVAPGSIADLATADAGSNTMRLTWTATGDDGNTGRATSYQIRYSTSPITDANFGSATLVPGPDPRTAGTPESFDVAGLSFSTPYYFAIKAFDEFSNAGGLSNVATGTTLGAPDVTATPASFSAELLTGATETQTLTLSNDAAGTLDFTIPTPQLAFSQPVVFPYQPLAKGELDTRVGEPVTDGQGGPDGFGYRWLDSDEPNGPAFDWVDITSVGTLLTITGDDAISAAIPMGMDFPFYGGTYNSIRVCTNGFLSFTDASTSYENQALPNAGAPANLVAPMWDDMDFGSIRRVYTYYDGARYIVSWVGVPHYQTGGPYTFQAILYPTGEIRFQYLTLGSPTNSATVGIQNAAKSIGLGVAFNTSYLKNNHAVRIVPLQQWLTVSPTSGRILAGQSMNVEVRFNALGLTGGNYTGDVNVQSNDPDEGSLALPASLHVIGAPDIAVSPASLDFGEVFVGATPTRNVTVSNPGTDNLTVTGITSDDPTVSVSPASFTLAPLAAQVVVVTYAPTSPSAMAATLSIASNDPDTPTKTVTATGSAVPAPSFTVTPESFEEALQTDEFVSRILRVGNTGGSNYVFTAEALDLGPTGSVTVGTEADVVPLEKDQPDVQFGPAPLRSGGPDVFGYTYKDSDEAGGPAFSWVDVRSIGGTQITMTGDDSNTGPHPIGFSFPFYGQTFTSFRVSTNGFISFTSSQTTFTNTTLPNTASGTPPNLLAAFWDDLHFLTANRAWYYNDGTRLIIQFQDVPRRSETPTNTFEVILYPNGTIVYQYLTMNAVIKNSATIGIQNATKNDGLQVVFNANYVKNNLAIRFRPPARFLSVAPASGTVPPGGFMDLTVGFDATDLFGGEYPGAIRIRGNDPVLAQRDVPARLLVTGVPNVATSPASVAFGNVFVGFPGLKQLTVQNTGTDILTVSNVTSDDPSYGVDQTAFSVPPLGNAVLFVSFSPPAPGNHPATLTIHSNDPDSPAFAVPLSGAGLLAPDIGSTPSSLSATLNIPDSQTQTLTLHNTGGSDLPFVIGAQITADAVTVHENLELAKEEADPRPGILGQGGPDMFGYTWRDSDDPDGPAFDWVDITGVGTLLPLTGDDATSTGIPIGFDFPYYGNTFQTVNVCTNGWLSFTATSTQFTNQPLPTTGAPENLLAAFWDDLTLSTTPRIYTYRDGTRFIASYVAVPRLGSGGPYTFQVILYPSGRIVYQYLSMQGTRLNEASVGIENATGTDGLTVVHNAAYMHDNLAIEFRTVPDWLTANPTTGTIPAGGSMDVSVLFNTQDLFGGTYSGSLRIASNDPDEGVFVVPASLTAVGTADIASEPASLDFGSLYISQSRDLTVEVRNDGSDVLTIASGSTGHPAYSLVGATFPITLGHRGRTILTVRFAPTEPCYPPNPCAGSLDLASNDPDEGTFSIPLTGIGLIPPEAVTDPTSLRAALATTLGPSALTRTKTLRLSNTGGSDLDFTASALSLLPAAADATPSAEQGKDDPGQPGEAVNASSGGPDAFGYRWADSDDPVQGTPFEWIDITATGTQIPFTGDDQNQGPFPLSFPFTYYGQTFTDFRACTNGWISFTSTATTFTNTGLPNAATATPNNLLAAFWDDLTFSSAGDVYYHGDATRFVISYVNVPRLGTGGGPYTFQIILYPSGTIDFQYQTMSGTRLNEATIGIQNAAKDIGLQVVFNSAYVKNNHRIRFSTLPGWLTVSPASGTVPVGGHLDLAVGFSAQGLADGDYDGGVRIASNDLTDPVIDVLADLHVGSISLSFDLDPSTLNRSSNGNWVSSYVEPSAAYDPHDIRPSSLLLQRSVPWAAGSPISYEDKDADGLPEGAYKFGRLPLLSILPDGNSVPVEVIGELEDITWFSGTDHIRVLRPRMITAAGMEDGPEKESTGPTYSPGYSLYLAWDDPEGYTADSYDIWFSADGGTSWTLLAGGLQAHQYTWTVPSQQTTEGILEVVAMDAQGAMGSWLSPVFTIQSVTTGVESETASLPKSFGMRLLGANPSVSGDAKVELALPTSAPVQVRIYNVRGSLVRSLVENRTLAAGRHPVRWDGRTNAGSAAGSGIYFVQMTTQGKTYQTRVAMVR
ncbi:MAG TPA: S8 family serine peptidase [Candidatus Eisenbacteria bacterium]|nr:S8 family serine peptidase [Candidatus Eisenbacteria bacterium]